MKKLSVIFSLVLAFTLFGGLKSKERIRRYTVPLEKMIKITVVTRDTELLKLYDVYDFDYRNNRKTVHAKFWVKKMDTTFEIGRAEVALCGITEMQFDDSIGMRGCYFLNGFSIQDDDSNTVNFDFDEYGKSPTLRLCSTD